MTTNLFKYNGIGGAGIEAFNHQVVQHWLEASKIHGMPVDSENFNLFFYSLRISAAAEARLISHEDVLVSIASESGLNIESFLKYFHDDRRNHSRLCKQNQKHNTQGNRPPS